MESNNCSNSLKVNDFAALTSSESVFQSPTMCGVAGSSRGDFFAQKVCVNDLCQVFVACVARTDSFGVDRAHFVAWLRPLEVWF